MPFRSSPEQLLPPDPLQTRTLGFLLREAYSRRQQCVYEAVAAAGHPKLRALHSPVLRHLPPDGGRVADLARATGLAKQSVGYIVNDLVALGYLRIEPDPEDGRARRLRYTARGHKLLAALVQASREADDALAATLGAERLRTLREMLEAVLDKPPAPRKIRRARQSAAP